MIISVAVVLFSMVYFGFGFVFVPYVIRGWIYVLRTERNQPLNYFEPLGIRVPINKITGAICFCVMLEFVGPFIPWIEKGGGIFALFLVSSAEMLLLNFIAYHWVKWELNKKPARPEHK